MPVSLRSLFPQVLVNFCWHLPKAILANLVYGFPSRKLTIIGITGTSGKTTTAHLLHHILTQAGLKAAMISTISAKIGDQEIPTGLHVTNPEPFALQKLLRQIVKQKYPYLVLEVTSHGLDQHRCWGCRFTYGVLTNISHEHLDYHKTLSRYQQAKFKLIKDAKIAVLNQDDGSFESAQKLCPGKIITFSGQFQQANQAAATAVARDLGVRPSLIARAIKSFPGVLGRMETVYDQDFKIIIDFAHKPDALEKALTQLRHLAKTGRVLAVFGAAGRRDKQKRFLMGEIAGRLADITILTAEDPRTEDLDEIIQEIKRGCQAAKAKKVLSEPDRQKAINLAVKLAQPGDVIGLFGKGHEQSMCFGKIEYPWSEHQAVKKALKLRRKHA
jgi:UDP-N-acetylmuramoyl-L-alanyl-D-glutamate--2,6-diaminopimelate ligase